MLPPSQPLTQVLEDGVPRAIEFDGVLWNDAHDARTMERSRC